MPPILIGGFFMPKFRKHFMLKYSYYLLVIFIFSTTSYGQNTQVITGRVVEYGSIHPIPGAKIEVDQTNYRSVSDSLGYFTISNVPIGRVNLVVSAFGFKSAYLTNLDLVTGKQLALTIELMEDVTSLEEVTIVSDDKQNSFNETIKVSRRQFSIEESKRYAGSLNDVQRMASNFAGITTANDQVNDIIVRGNSPSGMLFRLDGMNIPNPNHWSMPGSAGGTVSMLNSNVLRNSDFLTGAFPAEYDAFSGVFDLKSRNGNYNKHEFLVQLGFNGLEAGAEGPISKKSRATYLFNYRKSLLEILASIMSFGTGSAVPRYQDAFLKLHFPTKKAGHFSFIANGGTSKIHFVPDSEQQNNFTYEDLTSGSNTGFTGFIHQISPSSKYSFTTTLLASGVLSKTSIDNTWIDSISLSSMSEPFARNSFLDSKIELAHHAQIKLNARNYFKIGTYLDYFLGNYNQKAFVAKYDFSPKQWITGIDYKGSYIQSIVYFNYLFKANEHIDFVFGLAYKYQNLTNKQSVDPKFSALFRTSSKGAISFGTGLYSKAPTILHTSIVDYEYDAIGNVLGSQKYNTNLKYMKSWHGVLGYDHYITNHLHIKTEIYYQYLFDVVTALTKTDSISADNIYATLNDFSFAFESIPYRLGNNGKGRNYGLELTVEHSMKKGFYFLITGSLFQSEYQAVDKVWRNTRFNSNFACNGLVGKELGLAPKIKLLLDLKTSYMKGNRYIPLIESASKLEGEAVYDYDNAYQDKLPDFFRMDVRVGFKFEGKKITQEAAFEAQNITNRRNVYMQQYNPNENTITTLYQNGFLPMGFYRIYF